MGRVQELAFPVLRKSRTQVLRLVKEQAQVGRGKPEREPGEGSAGAGRERRTPERPV